MSISLVSPLTAGPATASRMDTSVPHLSGKQALLLSGGAIASFHLAYSPPALSYLIVVYLFCLVQLAGLRTPRQAFYFGLATGYAVYAPHLTFFWTIFGWPAVALWTVLAFWLGLFVALARLCRNKFGKVTSVLLIPCVWTGLEYFRSELYYLRFSWLNVGYTFSDTWLFHWIGAPGIYGIGFLLMLACAVVTALARRVAVPTGGLVLVTLCIGTMLPRLPTTMPERRDVEVAGIQLEFPSESELLAALDQAVTKHPETELIVLSEYTLQQSPSKEIKDWCRMNRRYLVVGGKDFINDSEFYNSVFVVDHNGEIAFRQAKSVPVQFFQDGLPAREQRVWDSPWGKIGFAICYDLSYRRVMDRLIEQGAQALIIPTADEISWGEREHRLHARVAPVRAAEYGVPIFRVSSSGISQWVDPEGRVLATAPFPGQGETIAAALRLGGSGRIPLDRWLAPFSLAVTAMMIVWLVGKVLFGKLAKL